MGFFESLVNVVKKGVNKMNEVQAKAEAAADDYADMSDDEVIDRYLHDRFVRHDRELGKFTMFEEQTALRMALHRRGINYEDLR